MKKAHSITIKNYRSNIEVFAQRNDDDGNWGGSGWILLYIIDADTIPSAYYAPTIKQIYNDAKGYLTVKQCREIKNNILEYALYNERDRGASQTMSRN